MNVFDEIAKENYMSILKGTGKNRSGIALEIYGAARRMGSLLVRMEAGEKCA